MADPEEPRRSRTAWPGPMSVAGVGEGHSHELPGPLVKRVRLLTWALVVVGGCLAIIVALLMLFILDRAEQRDRQNERLQQEIRDSWCTALDTFPEGGLLDELRETYGCGPGRPLRRRHR